MIRTVEQRTTIREQVLRELVAAATGIVGTTVEGQPSGYSVLVHVGEAMRTLATSRGGVRLFASLDTASGYLRELGIDRFDVDMRGYKPGRLRRARPDRAEALRRSRTKMRQQYLELLP